MTKTRQHQANGRGNAGLARYPPPASRATPMLRAVPASKLAGTKRITPRSLGRNAAEMLYTDTSWRPCRVVSWARIRGGRALLIAWPDRTTGWYKYDPTRLRPI
jgi:hypothetical protein